MPLELGLDTFGDVTLDADGRPRPQARVIRDVVAEAVLADSVGTLPHDRLMAGIERYGREVAPLARDRLA